MALRKVITKKYLIIVVSLLCCVASFAYTTAPFFHDGFFATMDDVQVVRIDEMSRELESGQFPVRYVANLGNGGGYMLFHFYAPFVYYLGAFYHLIGFPLVVATKLVFLTGYSIGTIGMLVLLKQYADWLTAAMGTALFVTAPYFAYDVYTRGALAEFFAFCLLPWLFWAFLHLKEPTTRFVDHEKLLRVLIAGFIYGLMIITHNITSFTATIFLLLLLFLPPFNRHAMARMYLALITGACLATFFWLPVLLEQKNTVLSTVDFVTEQYKSNFLNPLQLAQIQKIPWGFTPPLFGIGLFAGLIGSMGYATWKHRIGLPLRFSLLGAVLSLVLIWGISRPVWDIAPYMRFMQFPWRYLAITTVLTILAIAMVLTRIKHVGLRLVIGIMLLLPALTLTHAYLRPASYNFIGKYYAEDSCRSTSWAQEQLPIWVSECLPKNNSLPAVLPAPGIIVADSLEQNNGRHLAFTTQGFGGPIQIAKYYYPGWYATIDGQQTTIKPSGKHGLITLTVPPGPHTIAVMFKNTSLWTFANTISLATLLITVVGGIYLAVNQAFLFVGAGKVTIPRIMRKYSLGAFQLRNQK